MDRLEFLRSAGRWSALVAIGGGVWGLARRGRVRPIDQTCLEASPCGGCAEWGRCDLPGAVAALKARKEAKT